MTGRWLMVVVEGLEGEMVAKRKEEGKTNTTGNGGGCTTTRFCSLFPTMV